MAHETCATKGCTKTTTLIVSVVTVDGAQIGKTYLCNDCARLFRIQFVNHPTVMLGTALKRNRSKGGEKVES